jgi:uroporphyrinogen decarboxylase
MYGEPEAFQLLCGRLKDMVRDYLRAMVNCGADAIQLFDTWAGILNPDDYRSFVLPFVREIFDDLKVLNIPLTYFVHNGSHLLHEIKETGCTVVSLDGAALSRRPGGSSENRPPCREISTPPSFWEAKKL